MRVALAFALACSLGALPFAAHAESAGSETASTSSASAASSASASSSASAASQSASSSSASQAAPKSQTYAYKGTYAGKLEANGKAESASGETVKAKKAGHNAALAQKGGTLDIDHGKLEKAGDDADAEACDLYGVNATALAVGKKSKLFLDGTALASSSTGSHGLFATDKARLMARDVSMGTKGADAAGAVATFGGSVLADAAKIQTKGAHSPGLMAGAGNGKVSVTNSSLATAGIDSPLVESSGTVEIDNIEGVATSSPVAAIDGAGSLLVSNSSLNSKYAGDEGADSNYAAVAFQGSEAGDSTGSDTDSALFQATDSAIETSIESGSLFGFENASANVVLCRTSVGFDAEKANLLVASGSASDATSTGKGTSQVAFTNIGETLAGNIQVDGTSTLDFFLLEGSTWTGSASIVTGTSGEASKGGISMNIDATSGWIVTENSAVTDLNLAKGARLVDQNGDACKILDADGNTVVDGASDITVAVKGTFSTTVTTTSANAPEASTIDREAFDEHFDADTAYGTNGTSSSVSEEARARQIAETIAAWFK